ncbi:hypothetical protein A2V68_02980 [candidate division Kazan bacterium RBG_13_50_9]|uniref:Peptidase S11 D-alanyl-D-alanine carboxypeptidase A N-terminal domain-containing protein n=1 Tax=candidate division Kazan bacterium RBG_13_50_9 TaxID=1798535 RepID=A0A1F4NSR9_UNCK3|nr:MAG: hypothetical protein A2V68_02980 [candidate division Kazan bacterium RBG_13_50_9]
MKTLAIFLVMFNFLTGSLNTVKDGLLAALSDPRAYPLQALTIQLMKPEPIRNPLTADPVIEATSAIVIDAQTGKVLFEKNANRELAMASITKIMTAMVVLKYTADLDSVARVSEAAAKVSGSQMYLLSGETITVRNLLAGMLIESANDAAYALAEYTFGNITRFADAMNRCAAELKMTHTHFANAHGADERDHYSTARDLAALTAYALNNETFRQIVHTQSATVTDTTGRFKHRLENTNKLMGAYANVIGGKTGTTLEAGASLSVAAEGDSGQTIITVLLDSPQRFTEGKILLDWALKAYSWVEPL